MCCSSTRRVIKSDSERFLTIGGLHEDKLILYDNLQRMTPTNVVWSSKSPYSISRATSIDPDCRRLPTALVLGNKRNMLRSYQFR